jgi:Ca-activated chloride channel family protein
MVVLAVSLLSASCSADWFVGLWLTPDQQGQRAFDRGDYAEAAARFDDPMWRGTALYMSEQFAAAVAAWAEIDTAEAWFNRGVALAQLEQYPEAIAAFEHALELRPEYPEARANVDYLQPFLPLDFSGGDMGTTGRDAAADDVVFDADADTLEQEGKDTVLEGEQGLLSDEQLAQMWLSQVDASPAAFLRHKFQYQAQISDGSRGPGS